MTDQTNTQIIIPLNEITKRLSNKAKEVLTELIGNENLINEIIKFINTFINEDKLSQYTYEIKKIILSVGKGIETGVEESIEILVSIRTILKDLYSHLESLKTTKLTKTDRLFVANNIEYIRHAVIVMAIDGIDESDFISKDGLIKILKFIKSIGHLVIDMTNKKNFPFCCFKARD
ncbi:hypothetical protein QLL95_gp0731 [Cotonvirus japonicus]|uniref:Uncharacterized protein n=1 Tax=Cotonvirus japonicus TaxID=2811091 RepID=A0ABM7NT91_9VIRU|nr:hypothetical protein QLL95_gp0731 [Cotonvirus japonicus]BCS83392.1 hypothetical protein [Cotonvirus japonicus]